MIKRLKAVLLGALVLAAGFASAGEARQKVVYHINGGDAAQQGAALGNILNHINAVGPENIDIKAVLHGDGLSLLLYPDAMARTKMKTANATEEMQTKIAGLKEKGVQFQVCGNTLKARNVDAEKDLYDVNPENVVPSGVAEIGTLQSQGYAYIKP